MQSADAALDIPGARRRMQRWRSWWNKSELYPPSVDRWFAVRRAFFGSEGVHLAWRSQDAQKQLEAGFTAAQEGGGWQRVAKHVWRGSVLLWCKPVAWGGQERVSRFKPPAWHDG